RRLEAMLVRHHYLPGVARMRSILVRPARERRLPTCAAPPAGRARAGRHYPPFASLLRSAAFHARRLNGTLTASRQAVTSPHNSQKEAYPMAQTTEPGDASANLSVPARRPVPLSRRKGDLLFIAFFLLNLGFITYIVDLEQLVIANPAHFAYPLWPP